MDAYIKGEIVMIVDSVVGAQNKSFCRSSTNVDFNDLVGKWVSHDEFNRYFDALEKKAGNIGPQVAGRQAGITLSQNMPELAESNDPRDGFRPIPQFFEENNKGNDRGEFIINELTSDFMKLTFTGKVNERFHLGLFEGLLRFYKKVVVRAEITETYEKDGRSVFEVSWKDGLAG
ncbi:MAG: hypothetical protein R2883_06290 [Caldisericia bacterium]